MTIPKKRKYYRRIKPQSSQPPIPSPAIERILAEDKDTVARSSFCGKSQNEVKRLITGSKAKICNECIDICNEIIADDQQHGL